jgi:hypothetical protein
MRLQGGHQIRIDIHKDKFVLLDGGVKHGFPVTLKKMNANFLFQLSKTYAWEIKP